MFVFSRIQMREVISDVANSRGFKNANKVYRHAIKVLGVDKEFDWRKEAKIRKEDVIEAIADGFAIHC